MTAAQLLELRALADAAALHVEPWADDGQGGYQCANCQRDMWLRSSEYEPRGLCEECIDTALAAARSAVPALLDRVAELEAGLRAWAIASAGRLGQRRRLLSRQVPRPRSARGPRGAGDEVSDAEFDFVSGCIAAHPQMMGGQHVAMHCTAVIAIHKATGIAFRVDDERSQYKAKLRAVAGVRRLLAEMDTDYFDERHARAAW